MIDQQKHSRIIQKSVNGSVKSTPRCPKNGSGWMTLVPFESPHQAASNRTTANQPLPTPTDSQPIKHNTHYKNTHRKKKQCQCQSTPRCPKNGSGHTAVVPFESPHQAASNETTANQPLPTPTNSQPLQHTYLLDSKVNADRQFIIRRKVTVRIPPNKRSLANGIVPNNQNLGGLIGKMGVFIGKWGFF
jgi:hypothetical protein